VRKSPTSDVQPQIAQIKGAYDSLAPVYDNTYLSPICLAENDVIFSFLHHLLPLEEGPDVLELACGTGLLLDGYPVHAADYTGLDISPAMIAEAKKKYPGHHFQIGDMHDLSAIPSGSIDRCICIFGGLSYALRPIVLLGELRRVLRTGGQFFLMAYSPRYLDRPSYILNQHKMTIPTSLHTAHSWRFLFSQLYGFEEVFIQGFHAYVETLFPHASRRFLRTALTLEAATIGQLTPDACYFHIITGRK